MRPPVYVVCHKTWRKTTPDVATALFSFFSFFFVFLEQKIKQVGIFGQIKKLKCLAKDYQLKRIITVLKKLVQSDALHSSQEFEEYFSERKIDADQSSIY